MKTSLGAWAEGILEAVALMALAAVPAFANYHSQSVFEPDKAALLAAVAAFGAVASLVVLGEGGSRGWRQAARHPVVLAAGALVVAEVLATAAAVDRRLAILGSYERAHGLLTTLWLVVLFAAVAWRARRPDARRRLAAAALAGSAPVAAYALVQAMGADVVPGVAESTSRVFGTMANPIFLGAYLMLAVLVGLGLVADAWDRGARLAAGSAALVVAVDAGALALSDARGSLLGLGYGLLVGAAVALGARGRRRGVLVVVALALAGLGFLAVFNLPASPLAPLRAAPVIGRLGRITQTGSGSEATRLRIWRGVDRLVAHTAREEPARLLVGYGPESLKYEILPFAEVNVGGPQQADRLTDRAHNQLLDALVMTGLVGALARLAFLGAAFLAALAAVAPNWGGRTSRRRWIGPVAGAAVGVAAGVALPAFGGATVLLGLAAGMLAAAVASGLRAAEPPEAVDWLAVGLAAAFAAATVEAAFGIATVGPDTLLWGLAGLVVATTVPHPIAAMAAGEADVSRRHRGAARRGPRQITVGWRPAAAAMGLAFGLVAALFLYGLLVTSAAERPPDAVAVTLLMMLVSAVAGALAAALAGESAVGAGAASLVVVVAFAVIRASVMAVSGAPLLVAVALWSGVAMTLTAGFWLRTRGPVKAPVRGARGWVYVAAAAGAVALVQQVAVRPIQADIEFQMALADSGAALETDDAARFRRARDAFDRATRLRPAEAFYYLKWGELYTRLGQAAVSDPDAAAAAFGQAQEYAARAEAAEPLMPYHTFNRGHVQLVFAQQLSGSRQAAVAQNAAIALQEAFDAVPSDPRIASELAMARLLAGDDKSARDLMNYVLTLTPDDPEAYLNLGRATEAGGDLDGAETAYNAALEKEGPQPRLETRLALGELARRRDDIMSARGWYEQAAQVSPNSWFVLYNLGLLYRDTEDPQQAASALGRALSLAPESERGRVQAVLDSLAGTAP